MRSYRTLHTHTHKHHFHVSSTDSLLHFTLKCISWYIWEITTEFGCWINVENARVNYESKIEVNVLMRGRRQRKMRVSTDLASLFLLSFGEKWHSRWLWSAHRHIEKWNTDLDFFGCYLENRTNLIRHEYIDFHKVLRISKIKNIGFLFIAAKNKAYNLNQSQNCYKNPFSVANIFWNGRLFQMDKVRCREKNEKGGKRVHM